MRVFPCTNCGQVIYFENTHCGGCGQLQGFLPKKRSFISLTAETHVDVDGTIWRLCANREAGCNWLVAVAVPTQNAECSSCRLTRRRPAPDDGQAILLFNETNQAKRRLIFQLGEMRLPIVSYHDRPDGGLAFDLVSSTSGERVMIGHLNGVITVDLSEASDPHREAQREALNEEYRTMLGHFRHEIGHYYWQVLVFEQDKLESFREVFGDERVDYGQALNQHYQEGVTADWRKSHISHYATTHPWEDFAETFAHYLHIRDSIQTAAAFGLTLDGLSPDFPPQVRQTMMSHPQLGQDVGVKELIKAGRPLAVAINEINRSVGQGDAYPFVITQPVVRKLEYIHNLLVAARTPED